VLLLQKLSVTFNNLSSSDFSTYINKGYDEVLKWRKNIFKIPSGKAAKEFISELTFWLIQYNTNSDLHGIALKVYMLLPSLLLQKPTRNSKAKEHLAKLQNQLNLWKNGDINELIQEGKNIQKKILSSKPRSKEDSYKIFSKLMFEGKVRNALKFISNDCDSGLLPINDIVLKDLISKHPVAAHIQPYTLLHGPIQNISVTYFDSIDESMVGKAARLTRGAAGPSNLDADQYKLILASKKYQKEGKELREQIAILAKKLATSIVDPSTIDSLTACRLIPLSKAEGGVRPIGIGEVLRRIIGKMIGWVLKSDIQEAAGPLQACTGIEGGAEAAVHAMKEIFLYEESDAVILVDAKNAFNSLNRKTALHNIQYICPSNSKILINT